jgi:hypothetical protein
MSNEEEIARLKQKCEAKIRELRQKHQLEIAVKDRELQYCREEIEYLRKLNMALVEREVIYNNIVEVNTTSESKAMSDSSNKNINVGRDATESTLNIGDISGIVTYTISQLPASPQSDQPGMKELLTQLQAAIEAETDLSDDDKAEALEQVKTLAEVGKNPQESTMQKAGKKAMTMLKGILAGLPTTATLLEACSKLLPMIAKLLPLA